MPAYNFKKRFALLVESGQKLQTIRKTAKRAKRGAKAYFYTGQGTADCRSIGKGIITSVRPIEIGRTYGVPYASITHRNGRRTHFAYDDLDGLAKADGFASGEEMIVWFEAQYRLPFTGYLHEWVPTSGGA